MLDEDIVDLAADATVTTQLLFNPNAWRSRVVEELVIDSALICRSSRSLQLPPMRAHVPSGPKVDKAKKALLVLPIATLPKGPLVSFSLEVDQRPGFLLKRSEIAERQVHFIDALATADGILFSLSTAALVKAICDFTPGFWRQWRAENYRWSPRASAIRSYVEDGLGLKFSDDEYGELAHRASIAGRQLSLLLNEQPFVDSSSENALLALPLLANSGFADSVADTLNLMTEFNEFINNCVEKSYRPLLPLAEYGRRYEALVQCRVPLDLPSIVTVRQELPMAIGKIRGNVRLDVLYNDAESNHISLRVEEPDVRMKRRRPLGSDGSKLGEDASVLVRDSREEIAYYGYKDEREYILRLRFRLTPSRESTAAVLALLAITALGGYLALRIRPLTSDELAVLIVPTTLTSGFLLAQSRTSLAAQLQRPLRVIAILAILGLWAIVAVLYLGGYVELGG